MNSCRFSVLFGFLACLTLFGFAGCTALRNCIVHSPPNLAGKWENRLGSQWTLHSDGTFEILHGGRLRVSGTYGFGKWPESNKLTLAYTGGAIPWDGHEDATYRVKQEAKTLRLIGIYDICAVRIADFSVKWKKKN